MEALTEGAVVGTALRSVFVTPGGEEEIDVSANMTSEVVSVDIEGPQTLTEGGAVPFTAFARNEGGQTLFSGGGFEWSSSNPLVVYMEAETGTAIPRSAGIAVITAKLVGTSKTTTHTVTVLSGDGISIDINPSSGSLLVGNTLQFTATVSGMENQGVTWSVEQINGGSIDASGLYTAPMSSGTFSVRATSQQDPSVSKTATVNVQMAGTWTVVILHPFGASNSTAYATDGEQQVGVSQVDGESFRACLWSGSAASFVSLNPSSAGTSECNDVQNGVQVGQVHFNGQVGSASLWLSSAASHVSIHPTVAVTSQVYAIDGDMQGGVVFKGRYEASLWSGTAASWRSIHPAGATDSWIRGMHNGQQVGQIKLPNEEHHASLWTGSAGSLVDLNPPGSIYSVALEAHNGVQVGSVQRFSFSEASLWTGTAGSWVNLHPSGYVGSQARDVYGAQQVGHVDKDNNHYAALWSGSASSFVNLHQYLPARFSESTAEGIWQGNGKTYIVGSARDRTAHPSGHVEAVMWVRQD